MKVRLAAELGWEGPNANFIISNLKQLVNTIVPGQSYNLFEITVYNQGPEDAVLGVVLIDPYTRKVLAAAKSRDPVKAGKYLSGMFSAKLPDIGRDYDLIVGVGPLYCKGEDCSIKITDHRKVFFKRYAPTEKTPVTHKLVMYGIPITMLGMIMFLLLKPPSEQQRKV